MALVTVCLLSAPGLVMAAHPDVTRAREAYDRGDINMSLGLIRDAEKDPTVMGDDLAALYWVKGSALLAKGKKKEAASAFDRLLTVRPLFEPSIMDASPDLMALFSQRKDAYTSERGVTLGAPTLQGSVLSVAITRHGEEVSTGMAFIRPKGAADFTAVLMPVTGRVATAAIGDVRLLEAAERAQALELMVEARNSQNVPLARLGTTTDPLVLPVTAESLRAAPQPAPAPAPVASPVVTPAPVASAPSVNPPLDQKRSEPTPVAAAPVEGSRGPNPVGLALGAVAGGLLLVGVVAVVGVLLSLATSVGSLVGLAVYPKRVGADREPLNRSLFAGWGGGALMAAVFVALGSVMFAGTAALGLAAFLLR